MSLFEQHYFVLAVAKHIFLTRFFNQPKKLIFFASNKKITKKALFFCDNNDFLCSLTLIKSISFFLFSLFIFSPLFFSQRVELFESH